MPTSTPPPKRAPLHACCLCPHAPWRQQRPAAVPTRLSGHVCRARLNVVARNLRTIANTNVKNANVRWAPRLVGRSGRLLALVGNEHVCFLAPLAADQSAVVCSRQPIHRHVREGPGWLETLRLPAAPVHAFTAPGQRARASAAPPCPAIRLPVPSFHMHQVG